MASEFALKADFGTADFEAAYQAAISGTPRTTRGPREGTLSWLIERYRDSAAWTTGLSAATRRQRENIFLHVIETAGEQSFAKITAAIIVAGRDRRAATPAQARNFLDAMRGLFRWAVDARMAKADPTAGVKNPPRKKGPRLHARGPRMMSPPTSADGRSGTRQRVWLDVLLYTGLRRGDAVRLGRQHVRDGSCDAQDWKRAASTVTVTLPDPRQPWPRP